LWGPNIVREATGIARSFANLSCAIAATELREDLWAMRGDMYAQNELLSNIYAMQSLGYGGNILLNNWDPAYGTWRNIEVCQPGMTPIPIETYPGYGDPYQYPTDGTYVPPVVVDQPQPVPQPVPGDGSDHPARYRTVFPGDTLTGIAQDDINQAITQGHDTGFYNDVNGYVQVIASMNHLTDPNTIYAGEVLELPPFLS
jgi:hypothetical protein